MRYKTIIKAINERKRINQQKSITLAKIEIRKSSRFIDNI